MVKFSSSTDPEDVISDHTDRTILTAALQRAVHAGEERVFEETFLMFACHIFDTFSVYYHLLSSSSKSTVQLRVCEYFSPCMDRSSALGLRKHFKPTSHRPPQSLLESSTNAALLHIQRTTYLISDVTWYSGRCCWTKHSKSHALIILNASSLGD